MDHKRFWEAGPVSKDQLLQQKSWFRGYGYLRLYILISLNIVIFLQHLSYNSKCFTLTFLQYNNRHNLLSTVCFTKNNISSNPTFKIFLLQCWKQWRSKQFQLQRSNCSITISGSKVIFILCIHLLEYC